VSDNRVNYQRFFSSIRLAKKNRTSKQGMAEIFKQFGDHLYA
jgi:hypothetical protein